MSRGKRPVIGINIETGERKLFDGITNCACILSVSNTAVIMAIARVTTLKGWKLYDTPDNIRKRIALLEQQIKMLENRE